MTVARIETKGVSSSTRACMMSGYDAPANLNIIDFVTIATKGDARDFGDLTETISVAQSASNSVRGVRMGGITPLDVSMDYITIATRGDAVFFGDLLSTHKEGAGMSNAHGGL